MELYFKFLICFMFYISVYTEENKNDVIRLLKDIMAYYKHPNKLFTYTCWEKDLELNLKKHLQGISLHSKCNVLDNKCVNINYSFIFADMACNSSKYLLEKMNKQNLFTPTQSWLLLNENSDLEIQTNYFPINSNVYFIEKNLEGYSIKKIYKSSLDSMLVEKLIGNWSRHDGYREIFGTQEERKVRNLMREQIKISYVVKDADTIAHLDDYQYNILTDTMTKLNYAVLQHLSNVVNATKIDTFRRYFEKKQFDGGMIDDLKSGNFDIGGTPLEFLSERIDELSVLAKTAIVEKKFIFRATPHSYISNVFTLPFDSYVWYSCFGLIAIIFIISYVVVYWEWEDPIFKRFLSPRLCLKPNPIDIFLMEVGSAAQQGFESEPRSNSGRIVFIFTLISLMFLYTSFSANIVALLQSTAESLNSLDALFESRIPVGFKENISMDYFNDLKYENKSKEFYSKLQKPVFLSIDEGIKMVQKDFFAFYADTSEIYKYVKDWFLESEKCSLREIPFKNSYVDYWLFMKKNSDYRDIFRTGINKIHQTGIRNREYKRFFTTKPQCDSAGGNFESVGLADSYGAFLVMGAGITISIMLFFAEHLWVKYNVYANIKRIARLNTQFFKNKVLQVDPIK